MKRLKLISLALVLSLGHSVSGLAQDQIRRVVEEVPSYKNIYRVAASKTPSGFPVPRYVSLKVGKVNGRKGPSRQHPIAWQYRRKGLPLIVIAETDMWRKVRDVHGDESWIHKPALSGERRVIIIEEAFLHHKPRDTARIKADAERGALMTLIECNVKQWCLVQSDAGHKGWTPMYKLWGAKKLY